MGKIQVTDFALDPSPPPPAGAHLIFTKAGGLFSMDSAGVVTGPFTGGSGPPSGAAGGSLAGTYPNPTIAALAVGTAQLANLSVTNGKLALLSVDTAQLVDVSVTNAKIATDAVQTAQIAASAVIGAKIANGTISADKFVSPGGTSNMVLYSNSGVSWTFGLIPLLKFGTDGPNVSRIIIKGDLGTVADPTPLYPRLTDGALDLGNLAKTKAVAIFTSQDFAIQTTYPTAFRVEPAGPISCTLPDARRYPSGTEIVVYNDGPGSCTLLSAGTSPPYTTILSGGPLVINASTGRRFLGFQDGWRLTGTF